MDDISDALIAWRPNSSEFFVVTAEDWALIKSVIPKHVQKTLNDNGVELMPLVLDEGW